MLKEDWIKVEDRLPESNDDILVCYYNSIYEQWETSIAFYDESLGEFWTTDDYDRKVHPTHWMPIVLPIEED